MKGADERDHQPSTVKQRIGNMNELYSVHPIGFIRSALKRRSGAPRQGSEGAPNATLDVLPEFIKGLDRARVGSEIIVISWLHCARRNVLKARPRDDPSNPLTGVFLTRSPDRPNPIGLHRVKIIEIAYGSLVVGPIEAIDGTPVIDIKPVIASSDS
jgi:tRNA-Thr(GGU) m(6)t(6)A37 methyltransferase TsaA